MKTFRRGLFVFACLGLVAILGRARLMADDAPATPPADATASTAGTPELPAYFTGKSPDPKKPLWPDPTGAASGTWATPAGDGAGDNPAKMSLPDVLDRVNHNMFSINIVWTLVTAFLGHVHAGRICVVETGLCRAKNSAHTFSHEPDGLSAGLHSRFGPMDLRLAGATGSTVLSRRAGIPRLELAFGAESRTWHRGRSQRQRRIYMGALGHQRILPKRRGRRQRHGVVLLQMVFMDTTATIPTGAMAERWSWKNFCLYGLWVAVPYCIYANWVWGGGWLAQIGKNWSLGHGAVDFAGSGVVHAMGGDHWLGRRDGASGRGLASTSDGKPQAMPGHQHPHGRAGHVYPGLRLVRL